MAIVLRTDRMEKMQPTPRQPGEESFKWTDDETVLLLHTATNYKTQKLDEGIDWERVRAKYCDIACKMAEHVRNYQEQKGTDKDYPHNCEEITKERVASKLKSIRRKYRAAVESGRKSRHGRVILLYFEECKEIWGSSPEPPRLQNGTHSLSPTGYDEEEYSDESATFLSTTAGSTERGNKRKILLDDPLTNHKRKKLHKKVSFESQLLSLAREELDLKKEVWRQQKDIDAEYKQSMTNLSGIMENIGKSIAEGFKSLQSISASLQQNTVNQPPN